MTGEHRLGARGQSEDLRSSPDAASYSLFLSLGKSLPHSEPQASHL